LADWDNWATGAVVALAVGGVIFRPWGMKEAIPAVAGAGLLVLAGLLPANAALRGIGQGTDVYLFLAGMMVLAELARDQGLFDWLAAHTARRANGSAKRLFLLVYLMGVLVTVFLSNDATAVVLSPAVAAMARGVRAADPLPYLLICAFVANAASFVLPISNPANLVIYGQHVPKLLAWLRDYTLAASLAMVATFLLLRFTQAQKLRQAIAVPDRVPVLGQGGRMTGGGICGTAVLLLLAAAFGIPLGAATAFAGFATFAGVCAVERLAPWNILKQISWSTLPLVAGLFVLVAALDQIGVVTALAALLRHGAHLAPGATAWAAGLALAFGGNATNNLPAGLLAAHALQAAGAPTAVTGATLIGVDLGPNLSVTGSLATILWLQALSREGVAITAWQFLKLGVIIMPPALLLALIGLLPAT
jgi:arsenical pump membrane protein